MTQEAKYYTPSINEFHVGFEYEIYSNDEWKKTEVYRNSLGGDILFKIEGLGHWSSVPKPRVKFLDREDIESLGFVFVGCPLKEDNKTCDYPIVFTIKEHLEDLVFGKNPKILYLISIVGENLYDIKNIITGANANKVLLKNKSELKRLLTQLGI